MTFEEDLTKRRIDVAAFAAGDPAKFAEWQQMYMQMHPNSFYISVKMVLNDVRRKFWLAEVAKPAITITTEAPAKPAGRRAAIPGAAKPAIEAVAPAIPAEQPEQTETKPVTPVRGRAVIRKPAATSPEETSIPDVTPAVTPANPEEAPPVVSAPRPRPVFRKPATTSAPAGEPVNPEQIARDNTNQAAVYHTNPDPETETPVTKPAPRPRPVIKRPLIQSNTAEENTTVTPPAEVKPEANVPEVAPETQSEPKATPPRPRPVMRRPPPEAALPPVTTAPELPTAEEPTEEPINIAKPPRPRPVFKRPSKPEDNSNS